METHNCLPCWLPATGIAYPLYGARVGVSCPPLRQCCVQGAFTVPTFTPNAALRGGSDGKESACNAGDSGSIPGSGRPPGEGNPLQYSCLENPTDRGARQGLRVLDMIEQLTLLPHPNDTLNMLLPFPYTSSSQSELKR